MEEEEEGKEKEEGKTVRGSASNVSLASWIKHEYATYQEGTRSLFGRTTGTVSALAS